ncbi:(d)CMP kinase [Candidatus Venteria ishoeyi]|uniref:Cytidylate kinase n=1 Tax=Candidatus Venteria ishoeyi TaxID=1899563 RepID=A0A1H6FEM8_9GAMM|nr:(d)CMP kinase [Candidatus Venteria ishoeyi]MDM8544900.1 (d)CMP kinase [Candidatus Venteria ishoeyi]SEH08532.1 Cytidylate kinase [Candidatus Venteria ishoeyi]
MSIPVITIDGPGGVGKGTAAQAVAEHLGWHILDSGALYRVLGQAAVHHQVALDDESKLAQLAENLNVEFMPNANHQGLTIWLDGDNVDAQVRSDAGGQRASQVAVFPAVREALLHRQHKFRVNPGLVADGRDMGTVVFPDAHLKIFLTASPEVRAKRRYKQLKEKGNNVSLAALIQALAERDERDSSRATAPLKPADDALQIDTGALDIKTMIQTILNHWFKISP